MKPKTQAEFKKLQAAWDKKLARSGFQDAEQRDGNLTRWHSYDFCHRYAADKFRAIQEYYEGAGRFLHDYSFKSELDRNIWELHSEGHGIREIVIRLRSKKVSKWKVHQTIKQLAKEMTLRWTQAG